MAKAVAKSASRALGLIIAKCKANGGLPYDVFTQLYNSAVWPVVEYGASIWGTADRSCIEAVQMRACRYFLGVGRYTPNAAVNGEMGWKPTQVRVYNSVCRTWCRLTGMNTSRLNKRVFSWAYEQAKNGGKNWVYRVIDHFNKSELGQFANALVTYDKHFVVNNVENTMYRKYVENWFTVINRETAIRGNGRNKLRTYRLFKTAFQKEKYVCSRISFSHRSSLAKFRCGVAPLRLETGRFEGLDEEERVCFNCPQEVESEEHVLIRCPVYDDIRRNTLFEARYFYENFENMSNTEQMCIMLADERLVKSAAKTCNDILARRRRILYS